MPLQVIGRAALTIALLLALSLETARVLRGDGGVFSSTRHGDPVSGIQRLTGQDYPIGSCVQCHYQHASVEGASTGTPNPYALFAPDDNNLCGAASCHSEIGTSHTYPGLTTYSQSAHAMNAAVVWPGPIPWRRRSTDAGKCINCHDPHGYADTQGLIPTLGLAREEALCLACHDGSPAHTNIQAELTKTYHHPTLTLAGRHRASEGGDPTKFGVVNRHGECDDCHNAHVLTHPALPASAPAASSRLLGTSYVEALNGAAWTPPSYVYHAPDDPTPIQYEYQLCFKCHSSWTSLPLISPSGRAPTDTAREFNPNNASYHPVEAPGKQTGAVITNSLLPPYTQASVIYCSDCHGSDSPTDPAGPHGSNYRYLLKRYDASAEHSAAYQPTDFALCYGCHRESALLNDDEATQTNFKYHKLHLQDAAGRQPFVPLCVSCHGSSHGSANARLVDFSQEPHLTSFTSWASKEAGGGRGQCTLICHGRRHTLMGY